MNSVAAVQPDQKVALVTGASRGIGAAVAIKLASIGYRTVVAARSVESLESVCQRIAGMGATSFAVPTDVSKTAELDALIQQVDTRLGRLDLLVNNAGSLVEASYSQDLSLDDWQHAFDLNLTAPWYLASRSKYLMDRGGRGGVVVNMSSSASFYPSVGFSAYNASKAGLTMLTKTLALEWARDRIRVVGLAPGKIDTAMIAPILDYGRRRNLRVNPLGRVGTPEEVAELVAFLASDAAAFITGTIVTIDGGEVAASGSDGAR